MILLNTNIDFISPSGGILQDIDHVEFIPLGSEFLPLGDSPDLPSGSLWLRPNDGQLERLNYHGTSGIFDARNAEGYAVYTTTTRQVSIFDQVNFGTVVLEDSLFITQETITTFRINVHGLWRVTYVVRVDTPVGGSQGILNGRLGQLNPVRNVDNGRSNAQVASNGDQGGGCLYVNTLILFPKGALIDLTVTTMLADTDLVEAMLTFELIRPDLQIPVGVLP